MADGSPIPRLRFRVCGLLAVGLLAAGSSARADSILLYDPDANHGAIVEMTRLFDAFLLGRSLPHRLRPSQRLEAFERTAAEPDARFAIVAASYLKAGGRRRWKPLLVPAVNGDPRYRRILVTEGQQKRRDLTALSIAATVATGQERAMSRILLRTLRAAGFRVKGARIVPVSKDVDGLMAVAVGSVNAGLVTEASWTALRKLNPALHNVVTHAGVVEEVLRAPLCAAGKASAEERRKLVRAIRAMETTAEGVRLMRAMGITGWVDFDEAMLK